MFAFNFNLRRYTVVQKSNERDFCGADGTGCDLKGCVAAKVGRCRLNR